MTTNAFEAFDIFGCPLDGTRLIEASAGTGKTWNLCGLYLRLLLERGLPVQGILVVTFTNAATAELRERIRSRIAETLARLRGSGPATADAFVDGLLHSLRSRHGLQDADMALRLDLALQTFDEASIFTIHGFCQRALAETPFSAAMPLALTLLHDDSEMRLDVVHDFWRRRIAGHGLTPELAAHLLDKKDSPERLAALLKRRIAKPLSRLLCPMALDAAPPSPAAWAQPLPDAAALAEAPPNAAVMAEALASARALWVSDREAILRIVTEALPRLNKQHHSAAALQQAAAQWDEWMMQGETPAIPAKLDKRDLLSASRLKPNKGRLPSAPHAFFDAAERLLALHAARGEALSLQRLRLLRELLDAGPRALRRAKRKLRLTAFDDMLFNLHERLAGDGGTALAASLRARFPAALIDEFQDTDPLQFAIFQSIYAGSDAPLFLVGDPKQAIYSFRNADLHTYLRARHQARAEYTLAQNQRSSRALLDALNALFGTHPQAFLLPGLDYRPVALGAKPRTPLHDRSATPRAALQLWQLPRGRDGQPLPKRLAAQAAFDACAGEIARLLGAARRGDITLGDKPLSAGDIAVLVRSHAHGSAMRHALARLGVGSVELSMASVFDSPDAAELERLLAAMLEPARAPLLRAALATPSMGLDAGALQALAADEAALLAYVTRFTAYRELWLQRGVGTMLRRWMQAEGVSRRLLARPDGERRLTNLLHLAECLNEAAAMHAAPEALHRWLQAQLRERRHDDAAQLRLESDRDLVQVVTIHKSKGLEYPFVFCPLLWDGQPSRSRGGEGLEYRDAKEDAVLDMRTLDKAPLAQAKAQIALDGAAESMRLIYVALTRAVHRCVLVVGCYRRKHGNSSSVTESCRSRLNWLVAPQGLSPQAWLKHTLRPGDIDAAWLALAQRHAPHLALEPLPPGPWAALAPLPPSPHGLAALAPPRHIASAWWIGSYSSLAHGARAEAAAQDHDLRISATATDAVATEPAPGAAPATEAAATVAEAVAVGLSDAAPAVAEAAHDILRFPRGAVAGECLHAVFERVDFGDAAGWPAAIDAVLRRFAPALGQPQPDSHALWSRQLLRMLHDVTHTALWPGMRLADVPPQQRRVEMEFHLPAAHLREQALGDLLRRQGYAMPAFSFGTLNGYLRGFIDLVFEHGGRCFILDWKSNHLGDSVADYAGAALARTMDEQGYHLQALLYSLALHRHLQQRLPHYRYEQHFGGALYLFVRGVRPGWTTGDGAAAGVHAQRPSLQTLERLSALLDGTGSAP